MKRSTLQMRKNSSSRKTGCSHIYTSSLEQFEEFKTSLAYKRLEEAMKVLPYGNDSFQDRTVFNRNIKDTPIEHRFGYDKMSISTNFLQLRKNHMLTERFDELDLHTAFYEGGEPFQTRTLAIHMPHSGCYYEIKGRILRVDFNPSKSNGLTLNLKTSKKLIENDLLQIGIVNVNWDEVKLSSQELALDIYDLKRSEFKAIRRCLKAPYMKNKLDYDEGHNAANKSSKVNIYSRRCKLEEVDDVLLNREVDRFEVKQIGSRLITEFYGTNKLMKIIEIDDAEIKIKFSKVLFKKIVPNSLFKQPSEPWSMRKWIGANIIYHNSDISASRYKTILEEQGLHSKEAGRKANSLRRLMVDEMGSELTYKFKSIATILLKDVISNLYINNDKTPSPLPLRNTEGIYKQVKQ